jgi:hypothetical protein
MVRPERRVLLAGASPARLSASAAGSRPAAGREIDLTEAGCRKPVQAGSKPAGRNKVNAEASSNYQPKGVWEGRAAHVTAKATDSSLELERLLDLSGVVGGGTLAQKSVEQERPSPAAWSGKDRWYKAGRLKANGAGRETEGLVVPGKACSQTRWREGALL